MIFVLPLNKLTLSTHTSTSKLSRKQNVHHHPELYKISPVPEPCMCSSFLHLFFRLKDLFSSVVCVPVSTLVFCLHRMYVL